jgi:hypothetical protein
MISRRARCNMRLVLRLNESHRAHSARRHHHVGRPGGYGPNEACTVAVGGGGGVLGPCGVFDTYNRGDAVTLPDGSMHYGSDCPAGVALAAGSSVGWASDSYEQGSVGFIDNGCGGKGLCGHGGSHWQSGGGWQICFAA